MRRRMNWFFCLVLCVGVVGAQEVAEVNDVNDVNEPAKELRVDGERILDYTKWFAQDKLEGRHTFTKGYLDSAKWAAKQFKSWGLEPAGEDGTYFQTVTIKQSHTYRAGRPELRVKNERFLMSEEDFTVDNVSTAATSVKAEVVFVGFGIQAPDLGLDEYNDVNVADKVVLMLPGSPYVRPKDKDEEEAPDPWGKHVTNDVKIKTAYEKGAAAVLYVKAEEEKKSSSRWRRTIELTKLKPKRDFLVYTINKRVLRAILKPDPQESVRGFDRRLKQMACDIQDKKPQSELTGVQARLKGYTRIEEYSKKKKNNTSPNVLAKIVGTDPNFKEETIVIGGHLDHLGQREGYIMNGADDNASGTAVVMEVARVLSEAKVKSKRTIVFACWTGEEMGLLGSKHFVERPCEGVSVDKIVAYFNADMVGLGDQIQAPGALNFPSIWEVIKRDQDKDIISIVEPSTAGPGGSDYAPFIKKGIESLALMTMPWEDHPDYHRPEDDIEKINVEILRKTGQFVLQGVLNLANETEVPLIIEHRQALYEGMRLHVTNMNPSLKESDWSVVEIDPYRPDKLRGRIASVDKKPKRSLSKGIEGFKVFNGDVEFLLDAAEALGCGRVVLERSDALWVKQGRLTRDGRYLLGMLEEKGIDLQLVSPHPRFLRSVLKAASKPFIVTGYYELNQQLCDQMNEKGVLIGVKFDPRNVDACVVRLEKAKALFGDTDNLILYLTSTEKLDEGKQSLYVELIKKGWEAKEIGGEKRRWHRSSDGERQGIAADNLRVLSN